MPGHNITAAQHGSVHELQEMRHAMNRLQGSCIVSKAKQRWLKRISLAGQADFTRRT